MMAHLSMTCLCGRSTSAPCPTVGDIPAVAESFADWGHDKRGMVRCPDCLAAGDIVQPKPARAKQPDLFGAGIAS